MKSFLKGLGVRKTQALKVFLLVFNSLSWYFILRRIMYEISEIVGAVYPNNLIVLGIFDLAIIGSGIVGSVISKHIKRQSFLYFWVGLGTIVSFLPLFLTDITSFSVMVFSVCFGISFGLGMPSCLAYFADSTSVENRGCTGGIIFFTIHLSAPFIVLLVSTATMVTSLIIAGIWRGLLIIILYLLETKETGHRERHNVYLKSVFQNRRVLLYLIPWLMFSLVDTFGKLIISDFLDPGFFGSLFILGPIIGTIFALIGGILSDRIGRKKIVVCGFVSLGLAYAAITIAPTLVFSWYLYLVIDAIAWGMFTVSFVLVLWGDLSSIVSREEYYVIGSIPFFMADLFALLFNPYVSVPAYAAFSVASIFLFLAILPLLYAPETLPKKVIEKRRLRKYLDDVQRVKKEYERDSSD